MRAKDIRMMMKIFLSSKYPTPFLTKHLFFVFMFWNLQMTILRVYVYITHEDVETCLVNTGAPILGRQHTLVVTHTVLWDLVYTVTPSYLHKHSSGILQCMHLSSFPLCNNLRTKILEEHVSLKKTPEVIHRTWKILKYVLHTF